MSSDAQSVRREVVIDVRSLSKCYLMYDSPQDRLKQMLWRGRKRFYREFWALRDVSFQVRRGETIGVIGGNGAGKSTLLKILADLLEPTAGDASVNGRVAALLELGTGFNPEFTGRQNVYWNASLLGLTEQEIDQRFDAIAAFAEIGQFMEHPVRTYSSGMSVRLAFAVLAHVDADILIIDEALAVGDTFFVQKCMRFLHDFKQRGTLFFVSHNTAAVVGLCDRALYLQQGKLLMQGGAKDVCERYVADQQARIQADIASEGAGARSEKASAAGAENSPLAQPVDAGEGAVAAFGNGGSSIESAELLDSSGVSLLTVSGGESVELRIHARANGSISNPLLGFYLKDNLGQHLFGDNTYQRYVGVEHIVSKGERITASFRFEMPFLTPGEYSFDVATGEGTQEQPMIHEWRYDALLVKCHGADKHRGLVGIPMSEIRLQVGPTSDGSPP